MNLDSIAEHDALEERHRFLETQDSDLRRAEAELRGIIAKINETSRGLFLETFTAIRRGFGEMFGELFGGGRADLQLMDGDDPLECGIEITARPPGKPAQSLSLLSGGEKTLTAVALLICHLPRETQPVLRVGRDGRAVGRVERRSLCAALGPFRGDESVCGHHAQQAHDGAGRRACSA